MLHHHRQFTIKDVASVDELVAQVQASHGQTLCQGYLLDGLLFLNDSLTSEPSRFWVYAVMQPQTAMPEPGYQGTVTVRQVESLTVNNAPPNGWGGLDKMIIDCYQDARQGRFIYPMFERIVIDRNPAHVCALCE